MTGGEACVLLVEVTRQLSASRSRYETWRLVALATLRENAELRRELEMVDAQQYVYRTRTQDARDVFIDHRDLRREAA